VFEADRQPMDHLDINDVEAKQLTRLQELIVEHRDLDDAINALIRDGAFNQLQVQRLKRKKLLLKDEIIRLQSKLIPDIIA